MSTNTAVSSGRNGLSIILALAVLGLIVGVIAQWNLPLISGPRSALIALFILGFIMCAAGGLSSKTERNGFSWLSPFVIIGMLLGAAAVYILYAGLSGRDLPLVSGEYGAFIALALVMALKLVNSRLHNWRLA
jgi:peptidoglycan/LPS O-acetylase OafA/YrhL